MRRLGVAAGAVALSLAVASCTAGSDQSAEPAPTRATASASVSPTQGQWWNQDDVMFARMMVAHHAQAVEMADIVLAKDGVDTRVIDLAAAIKTAQEPEITQLSAWLNDWGYGTASVPSNMDHLDPTMADTDIQALREAPAPEAGKLFVEQMIVHHQSAITMAQAQVNAGAYTEAVAMAQAIIDNQSAEITAMQQLLTTL